MAIESFRVEGLAGVLDTLKQLPPELVSKNGGPVRTALRKAAVLIQKQAQANVQSIMDTPNAGGMPAESTGLLLKNIITQRIKAVMTDTPNWIALNDDMVEALEMIAHKIGRILNGDPAYADSWVDIAGYAQLVADRLNGKVR